VNSTRRICLCASNELAAGLRLCSPCIQVAKGCIYLYLATHTGFYSRREEHECALYRHGITDVGREKTRVEQVMHKHKIQHVYNPTNSAVDLHAHLYRGQACSRQMAVSSGGACPSGVCSTLHEDIRTSQRHFTLEMLETSWGLLCWQLYTRAA